MELYNCIYYDFLSGDDIIMFKKNSMYFKLLFPTIGIILFQSVLIIVILFFNGSMNSMKDNAIDSLDKNVDNRANMLENTMIYNWSNLDEFENKILAYLSIYANDRGTTVDEILSQDGCNDNIDEILNELSDPALMALRSTQSTGIYFYFTNDIDIDADYNECPGFYFRDFDPISNSAQYSDVICLKGNVNIARKYSMALDSVWTEKFKFYADDQISWNDCYKPLSIFSENSDLSSNNLSYWNKPHNASYKSELDPNKYITYNRPIILNGKIIAMIGVEVQIKTLLSYIPYTDFDTSGQSGYMLMKYDTKTGSTTKLECELYTLSGSYINRLLGSESKLTLVKNKDDNTYDIGNLDIEKLVISVEPIVLYNSNAPFSNEQWLLAAVSTEKNLFSDYKNLKVGVIGGSILAFLVGLFMLMVAIKQLTKPLTNVIAQLKLDSSDKPINSGDSNVYEVSLLCTTLNDMKRRQKDMDIALYEERERYLIALESATDTFMEYDLENDCFLLYYFSKHGEKSSFTNKKIDNFLSEINETEICFREDRNKLKDFLLGNCDKTLEVRINSNIFSHMDSIESIDNYYWLAFKASVLKNEHGNIKKIIGNIRQITDQKRMELVESEAKKHDITTNFFNKDYGMSMFNNMVNEKNSKNMKFCACFIYIQNIDLFEAHYGRVFTGAILRNISKCIDDNNMFKFDILVRLSNDLFIGIIPFDSAVSYNLIKAIIEDSKNIYQGENPTLELKMYAGIADSENKQTGTLIKNSNIAMNYAVKRQCSVLSFNDLDDQEKNDTIKINYRPISTSINISKKNMLSSVFDIFEHTTNTQSAIQLILNLVGELFELEQIVAFDYDSDFKTNQISYQWSKNIATISNENIFKVSSEDYKVFESILSKNGTFEYKYIDIESMPVGVKNLLNIKGDDDNLNSFCCVIFENGIHSGRIIYKTFDLNRIWSDFETNTLYEITKIVSAHINIAKSNSASKAKSEFLSRVSHEIRTPMNAIIGMTRIAKEKSMKNENTIQYLDKIDHSANYLLSLINDVLDMSRIESGKMTLENKIFSVSKLAEDLDLLMRSPIELKNINFKVELEIDNEFILSDENRLRQVMINLLGNACKFTNSGGEIVLSITEVKVEHSDFSKYRFAVRDTGIGIKPDKQKIIFNAFSQVDTTAPQNGTGLGLSISSNIINAMNSRIELKSTFEVGSEFSFVLNLPTQNNNDGMTEEIFRSKNELTTFKGKKALIVEDNDINMEIAICILEDMQFDIDTACNGKEACDKFLSSKSGTYDIIFMDIKMPVMDGLTATREIRKNTNHPDAQIIPIIAMTANAFDEDMRRSIESGMNGHVAKPIDIQNLNKTIKKVLK